MQIETEDADTTVIEVKQRLQAENKDVLYFKHKNTIISYPDDDFQLSKGDIVVAADAVK